MSALNSIRDTSGQDVSLKPIGFNRAWLYGGLFILLVVVVLVAIAHWRDLLTADKSLNVNNIRTAKVLRGDLRREVLATGKIVVAESPTLYASADGIVTFAVKAGDPVKKGQLLLNIDSPVLNNLLRQENANLGRAQSELIQQRVNAKRNQMDARHQQQLAHINLLSVQKSFARRQRGLAEFFVSQIEFERAEDELLKAELAAKQAPEIIKLTEELAATQLNNAGLQVERQQLVVDELERRAKELSIASPVEGMVSVLMLSQKSTINVNQPLITVVDLTHYEAEVNVPEFYAPEMSVGMAADIKLDNQDYPGSIIAIAPEIQAGEVKLRLRFSGNTPDSLRQNQRVTANIIFETHPHVLYLPRGSYADSHQTTKVFKIQGNKAVAQAVNFGAASAGEIEVSAGLAEGDEVIVSDTSSFQHANILYLIH